MLRQKRVPCVEGGSMGTNVKMKAVNLILVVRELNISTSHPLITLLSLYHCWQQMPSWQLVIVTL